MSRGLYTGPTAGAYLMFTATVGEQAASLDVVYRWRAPFDCKIVYVFAKVTAITGTVTYSINTTAGSLIAARTLPTAGERSFPAGLTPAPDIDLDAVSAANRIMAVGDIVDVHTITAAASTISGAQVSLLFRVRAHSTLWTADDD